MTTTELLILINILGTLVTAFWLIKRVEFQKVMLEQQKRKIDEIDRYTSILKTYTELIDFDKMKKFVDNEKLILKQDIEIERRQVIKTTIEKLSKDYNDAFTTRVEPRYRQIYNELGGFAVTYFIQIEDPIERNALIKELIPSGADIFVEYVNQILSKKKH